MRALDAVAYILKKEGVEYLFAYPDNGIIEAAASLGIRPIIARGEKMVLNIADGYTRTTNARKPTVVVVQAGPGIENAFGAVAQAHSDAIPLLVLPTGPEQSTYGRSFDPLPPFRFITKWASRITAAQQVPESMRQAFWQLRNGNKGPVLLELPADVAVSDVPMDALEAYRGGRAHRYAGDAADVALAARMLREARRPVLLAGHGVLWAEACGQLRELAELLQAPVATSMAAKGAFPENHPLSLGTIAYTASRAAAQFIVKADLVFAVASGLNGKNHFAATIPAGKKLIQLTANPGDVNRDYSVDLAVIGDGQLVLEQILDLLKDGARPEPNHSDVTDEIQRARQTELDEWMPRLTSDEIPINPYRIISDLMRTVDPATTVITHDSGNPRDQLLTVFKAVSPRGYLGWGKSTQLGTGLGLALGAKLADPTKLCINVMGDLAFGTVGMEIETAVRERLPIMTVILNNSVMGGYARIMPTASAHYGSNRLSGDYSKVAEGLGAYSECIERPDEVAKALERGIEATRAGRPAVLEMITKEETTYPIASLVMDEISRGLQQTAYAIQ
jgi:acetolactate synthase-1/2/3 large subunit